MNNLNLKNKRILYIGPKNFNYDTSLIEKLKDYGASVDYFQINITSFLFRIVKKFKLPGKDKYTHHFYNKMLVGKNYDYVLVRFGYQLTENFLTKLRQANPHARFINFHWDSITPIYNYLHIIPYFDKVYSFDLKDCIDFPIINYLPLFYLDSYSEFRKKGSRKSCDIDILFIGSWKKDRYTEVKLTEAFCLKNGLKFFYYLHLPLMYKMDLIRRNLKIPKQSKLRSLSEKEILDLFCRSNAIIDFPSSYQSGLTMRTFEALGAGKRLITTNKNIIKEPFYNPEYIHIIDMNNLDLDINFIRNKPPSSLEKSMEKYSIGEYIAQLFEK